MRDPVAQRIWASLGGLAAGAMTFAILIGITTCTQRDRAFEDACRRAGGYVASARRIGEPSTGSVFCGAVAPDNTIRIVPLPDLPR